MKPLAALMGTAVVLSLALQANAQVADRKVADAKPGDVRVLVTAAIREPLSAVLTAADRLPAETAVDAPEGCPVS